MTQENSTDQSTPTANMLEWEIKNRWTGAVSDAALKLANAVDLVRDAKAAVNDARQEYEVARRAVEKRLKERR